MMGRCNGCGRSFDTRGLGAHRRLCPARRWTCECPSPTLDGLGECSRCHRVPAAIARARAKGRIIGRVLL